jgi:carbohydrate esterase-like sialic acid-specific acetylesterase
MLPVGHRFPLLALAVTLAALAAVPAGDSSALASQPDQVFILAGQSNMRGRGMPVDSGQPTDPRLLDWHATQWVVASDPLAFPAAQDDGVGPGMTFGLDAIADLPSATLGLVQCAVGGTPIVAWTPTGYAYKSCMGQVSAAGGLVSAVLFLQGETDAAKRYKAEAWRANFETMLAGLRATFGPELPVILAEIGHLNPANFKYQNTVRAAQDAAAAEDYKVALVHTDDLATQDGLHFTVDSYKTLGHRFADAWWALTNGLPPPPPPDFTVDATPDSLTLPDLQTFQYTVSYGAINGFAGSPALSVKGLPGGAKATFSPPVLSGGGTSALTITTSTATPVGTYDVTVTGTNLSIARTTHVTMDVLPPIPDFTSSVSPKKKHAHLSKPAVFKLKATPRLGYTGTINVSVSGLPPSSSGSFDSPTVQIVDRHAVRDTYTLTITDSTPDGTYPLTFTFDDGSLTHQATTNVVVG